MTVLTQTLLATAVRLLPRAARRRYREELDAELLDVAPRRGVVAAASVLAAAPRLRWDVLRGFTGGRPSVRCYLGLHGRQVVHPNPEDPAIIALHCTRCGHARDPRQYVPSRNADGVAWGGVHLSSGGGF